MAGRRSSVEARRTRCPSYRDAVRLASSRFASCAGWSVDWSVGEWSPFIRSSAVRTFVGMPTAAEHRREARCLDLLLEALGAVRWELDRGRHEIGVRGGTALLVESTMAVAVRDLDELARHLTAAVEELRRRAALCDEYTVEVRRHAERVRRWRAAVLRHRATVGTPHPEPWPGPPPPEPIPPFDGAGVG